MAKQRVAPLVITRVSVWPTTCLRSDSAVASFVRGRSLGGMSWAVDTCRVLPSCDGRQGRLHAALYLVMDAACAYYLLGGANPGPRESGAQTCSCGKRSAAHRRCGWSSSSRGPCWNRLSACSVHLARVSCALYARVRRRAACPDAVTPAASAAGSRVVARRLERLHGDWNQNFRNRGVM